MKHKISIVLALLICASFGCSKYDNPMDSDPVYHFHVDSGWLGGIGGMAYDKGTYHLFVQYSPENEFFSETGWAHATSPDLAHWKFDGLVLPPDENGYLESGSVIVDSSNTSGLARGDEYAYIAFFTYRSENKSSLGMACSTDKGDTWTKLPSLNLSESNDRQFSSPNVIWDNIHKQWVMTVVSSASATFYTSDNCIDWIYASEYADSAEMKDVLWESAELIPLESSNNIPAKWMLLVNRSNGPANGSSGSRYYIGDFDGKTFVETQYKKLWLDFGKDCSGIRTLNKDGEIIAMGWLNNWNYANEIPSQVFKKSLTIPRSLKIRDDIKHLVISQKPIIDESMLSSVKTIEPGKLKSDSLVFDLQGVGDSFIINADFDNKDHFAFWKAERFGIRLCTAEGESLSVTYDTRDEYYLLDRSGMYVADLGQPQDHLMGERYACMNPVSDWKFYIDGSSVEFLSDGGVVSITSICPKKDHFSKLVVFADNGTISYNGVSIVSVVNNK